MEYSRTFSVVPGNFRKKAQKISYQPNTLLTWTNKSNIHSSTRFDVIALDD